MEVIAHAGIYLAEGITYLDTCFAAKETAAEMVLILPEIVGGVIADVGTIALVSLHDVHRIHTLGMHGGEVLVIDTHLRLDPQSLLVGRITEEIYPTWSGMLMKLLLYRVFQESPPRFWYR